MALKDGVTSYLFGLVGGFSSLGLYCLYKHFLTRTRVKHLRSTDPRLSHVVIHNGIAYTAGQVGEHSKLNESDVAEQTRQVLAKIDILLAEAGTHKSRLLEARIWLKNIATDAAAMNKVWNEWVDPENKAVRYCVQSELARENMLVEIQVVAAL
eukprot:TRINITY_DN3387_c0_g2_i2.p1 TRINITY_DN3387_c0_g2~~TRINITY_DN3387_c0_g2_i2.p1  ORF type:complete len:154 (+),score=21.86 TRINITY_DN3387_c0_g2_i2:34-495(+)